MVGGCEAVGCEEGRSESDGVGSARIAHESRAVAQPQMTKRSATHGGRILMVLRPPLELYPPSINQAQILAEQGYAVSIVQESPTPESLGGLDLHPHIRRHTIRNAVSGGPLWRRALGALAYQSGVRRIVRDLRPELVMAFDAEAAYALGRFPRRYGAHLLWHFHEVPEKQQRGWRVGRANRYVWRNAHEPDLIVFPDPGRAEAFAADGGIDAAGIAVVANAPRPIMSIPPSQLRNRLGDRLPEKARVVLYHGAVGPDHGLEVAIRSMPEWPSDAHFVIKGQARTDFAARLCELARRSGVQHRVLLFDPGFQTTADHHATIAGADVGWTVLEPVSKAWTYSALASNKRFECMALGVPQIADQSPLLPELIEGNGCGLCIPHDSVAAAGEAVCRLLNDAGLRRRMSESGRNVHLRRYNYDAQFTPVLEWIGRSKAALQEPDATGRTRLAKPEERP